MNWSGEGWEREREREREEEREGKRGREADLCKRRYDRVRESTEWKGGGGGRGSCCTDRVFFPNLPET